MEDNERYLQALRSKDPLICKEIYHIFLPKVISMIIAKGGNKEQAREVFQKGLMVILTNLEAGDIMLTSSFGAYLNRICYHKYIDLCRINKLKQMHEPILSFTAELYVEIDDTPNAMLKENRLNLIWDCFEKMMGDCKAIILGKLEGKKPKSIMQQINYVKSENAYYKKSFDCMRKFRMLIEQHPDYITLSQ